MATISNVYVPRLDIKSEVHDVALGSEAKCREAGKIAIEGKDYVVQDGDIMHFRFNV